MSRLKKCLILGASSVLILPLVVACSSGGSNKEIPSSKPLETTVPGLKAPVNGVIQSSNAGAVSISAEWVGVSGGALIFKVVLDTHSVDLDGYDLGKLAVLRDDSGEEYVPFSWRAEPGGHHRSGTLEVPVPVSVEQGKARFVQLVIRDIAGVKESTLQWNLA